MDDRARPLRSVVDVPGTVQSSAELEVALEQVARLRARHAELQARADAAFGRYFARIQNGQRTSGAAWQRLENQVNAFTVDELGPAEHHAYRLLDQLEQTVDLDIALRHAGAGDRGRTA